MLAKKKIISYKKIVNKVIYTHIERIQIETLLNENISKTYIAKTLNISRSTINREVNKWV